MKKTTIYIDIEDDIASIIEKIASADQKIVALVLPKRPSVLQSSVNVQLLKRSADETAKNIVLITNDDQVMRLAGQSGLYVSGSLQSKPVVPESTPSLDSEIDEITDNGSTATDDIDPAQPDVYADDTKIDLKTPVGDLVDDKEEDIELDNTVADEVTPDAVEPKDKKPSKLKKFSIPNFNKFRTKLVLGALVAILLGAGMYWALVVAPKATIVLTTQKSESQVKIVLSANTSQPTVDVEQGLVPAAKKEDKQKLTGTFTATGTKDLGEKATGTVTFYNCSIDDKLDDNQVTVPAGTGISNGSKTFITQSSVTIQPSGFTGNTCKFDKPSAEVAVVASEGGDIYNLSPRTYSVAGFDTVTAQDEGGMSGGTTNIVKIVTDADVESSKQKILETAADNVKGKIAKLLGDEGFVPIEETLTTTQAEPVLSTKVGEQASGDVTLTLELTTTMLGIKLTDLDPFIAKETAKQINPTTQKIYDSGASKAVVSVIERPSSDTVKINFASKVSIGPLLEQSVIASEIAGKKAGEAKQLLESKPGVTRADIELKPFWVFSIPTNTSKISVTINE